MPHKPSDIAPEQEDPRFKVSDREALIGCVIAVCNFIWWFGFAYGLGSKPVADYSYVFGFPAWFFYSCIAGTAVFILVVIVCVRFLYKDISLDANPGETDE